MTGDSLGHLQAEDNFGGAPASQQWLAAYTRPRFEEKVRSYCEDRGFEVFLPSRLCWRRWSDRKKLLAMPLFPSYVFMRLDEEQRNRAVQAPGFLWFVHNRLGPVRVADEELAAVRLLLASDLEFDPMPGVQLGDEVEIVEGAMRGCRGHLLRKDPTSIVLQVAAINATIRVAMDPSWLRPLEKARRRPSLLAS